MTQEDNVAEMFGPSLVSPASEEERTVVLTRPVTTQDGVETDTLIFREPKMRDIMYEPALYIFDPNNPEGGVWMNPLHIIGVFSRVANVSKDELEELSALNYGRIRDALVPFLAETDEEEQVEAQSR